MGDRHARALADCAAIGAAQRFRAQARHASAAAEEAVAHDAQRHVSGELSTVVTAWHHQMAAAFDPTLGGLLAEQIVAVAACATLAEARVTEAEVTRETCAHKWRDADARCRRIEDIQRDHRRKAARALDEAHLNTIADRTTFAWSIR